MKQTDIHYQKVSPTATYNPQLSDVNFNVIFEKIKSHTLVDQYRCYELQKLVEQSSKLDDGHIIEIGAWRGGSGALIASKAQLCNINCKVYLCDTFSGVVKAGKKDSSYKNGEHANTSIEIVEELIYKLNINNTEILKGIFPEDTGHIVKDLRFRFCHIDVDVYQSAKDIITQIQDKIVVGGICVYDDYGFKGCDGITKYVEEQMILKDRIIIHNLNGHAIVIKI